MRIHAPTIALACALTLAALPCAATTPVHIWSQCFGAAGSSTRGLATAVDGSGNVLLAGSFTGGVSFGGPTLTAQATDIVLAKYSAGGAHLWSKRFGGVGADQAYALAVDGTGNIFLTGYFQEASNFGGATITATGSSDLFVAKYDPDGNYLWSRALGTPDADIGYSLAVSNGGDVYVTGYVHGIVPSDIVLAKYSPSGTLLWGKFLGSAGYDEGVSLDVDDDDNVIMTGSFSGTVDFGGGNLSTSSVDEWDVFVVKYTSAGAHVWSRRFGNSDLESGLALRADGAGNVVVTGYFSGWVNFGGTDLSSVSSDVDIFLAKYDANGQHMWSRRAGGESYETAATLSLDADSNVFLGGYFSGTANFGGSNIVSAGNVDIFFAEYRADGSYVSSQRFGGASADFAQSIAVDAGNNRYITGYFDGTMDFGGGPLVEDGTPDMFLVKFGAVVSAVHDPLLDSLSISAAPNPFNPSTTVTYRLPTTGQVTIRVYDVHGRDIATLFDGEAGAGTHTVAWNGRDHAGIEAGSGVYFARIVHAEAARTCKLVLLK